MLKYFLHAPLHVKKGVFQRSQGQMLGTALHKTLLKTAFTTAE